MTSTFSMKKGVKKVAENLRKQGEKTDLNTRVKDFIFLSNLKIEIF